MTRDVNDDALDALFGTAQKSRSDPSPDFMARLQADARAAFPTPTPLPTQKPSRANWLAGLFTASGLSGAALAGIWIGFAMPETLDTFTLTGDDSVALSSFLPSADLGAVFDE